jgi:hypothetical protein
MTVPIWVYHIRKDGTLRYHFRDFIDWMGDQYPPGTINIVEMFNEIMDCNTFSTRSGFQDDGIQCTDSFLSQSHLDLMDNEADCGLTTNMYDYFEMLALPSERAPSAECTQCTGPGVTAENKRQIWCELGLRARAKWGFPTVVCEFASIKPTH